MKYILGGSLETQNGMITAGVFEGQHEWDINPSLRYIQGEFKHRRGDEDIDEYLFRVYNTSTGCLIKGDFKWTN